MIVDNVLKHITVDGSPPDQRYAELKESTLFFLTPIKEPVITREDRVPYVGYMRTRDERL